VEKNGFNYGGRSISLAKLNGRYGLADKDFLNITELDQRLVSMLKPGQGGSLLTMTEEEIAEQLSKGTAIGSQYRQSQFVKLFDANVAIAEDAKFNSEIFGIYEKRFGAGTYEAAAARLRTASGRAMSDSEIAYRASAKLLGDAGTLGSESYNAAYDAVAKLHQRTALGGLGAENGLGSYVNTLGWSASTERQRLDVLAKLEAEGYTDIANGMRSRLIPIFNPEAAIDPSLGGSSTLSFGGSLEDMYESVRIFHAQAGGVLSEAEVRNAVNRSVYTLLGGTAENRTAFSALYAEFDKSQDAAQWAETFASSRSAHFAAFERLAADKSYTGRLTGLIDVATQNVAENMIMQTAAMTGELRATQILLGETDAAKLAGFDRLVSDTKLSSHIESIDNTIQSALFGYRNALRDIGDSASPEAVKTVQDTMARLEGILSATDISGKRISGVRKKAMLLNEMQLTGEAAETYGIASLPDEAKLMQRLTFKYRDAFNQGTRSAISEGMLTSTVDSMNNEILSNLSRDIGLPNPAKVISDNEFLLGKLDKVDTLRTNDELYHALVKAKILDEGRFSVNPEASIAAALDELRMAKQQSIDSIAATINTSFQSQANGDIRLTELMRALDTRIENLSASDDADQLVLARYMREALETENAALMISIDAAEGEARQVSLNRLYSYSRNENIIARTSVNNAKSETENVVNILRELAGIEDVKTIRDGEDVLSREFFEQIGAFDYASETSEESGRLLTTPSIVRGEGQQSVEQVIERMRVAGRLTGGGQADLDQAFIEDLLALSVTDSDTQEQSRRLIVGRFKDIEEGEKYVKRLERIQARYRALKFAGTEEMQNIAEVAAEGADVDFPRIRSLEERTREVLEGQRRAAGGEDLIDDVTRSFTETTESAAGAKYTRIGDMLKDLFTSGKPLGERGALGPAAEAAFRNKGKIAGVAALATGLAVYGHVKSKDHNEQSISGPPLLPGGNPYENMPTNQMQIPEAPISSGGQGMSYNISVDGDQDKMEQFMSRARISNKWPSNRYYA
jgi:hypothetical protein